MTAPQILAGSVVRRHLEQAGPSLAQLVKNLDDETPGAVPARTMALAQRVEQIKGWALESSSREAARLLTEGARRCLLEIDDYREVAEWVGGEPEELVTLRERGERLRRRVAGLGRQLPAWPALQPRPAALSLAHECLDLAEVALPGFEWARLQRGFSHRAGRNWEAALTEFDELVANTRDAGLAYHARRNALATLSHSGQVGLIPDRVVENEARLRGHPAWAYFMLESSVGSNDTDLLRHWCQELRWRAEREASTAYWLSTLSRRIPEWSGAVGVPARQLAEAIGFPELDAS